MNKKLQVFISSTNIDLIEERQMAVQAILNAGHIPAGMELFKGGRSQMVTIQKWIDESDVYMLILGGRYGSIEKDTKLSYTELEYKYALAKKMPVFAIVLSDTFLYQKASIASKDQVFEIDNMKKYDAFKKLVETNVVKYVDCIEEISTVISNHLNYMFNDTNTNITGWICDRNTYFKNNEEVDSYIAYRLSNVEKCVFDLSWKDYYPNSLGRANYTSYIEGQKKFNDIVISRLKQGISYRHILTFPCEKKERFARMSSLIKYDTYWCGFFKSNSRIKIFPKLHIIIFDEEEVLFMSSGYGENLFSSYDKKLVNVMKLYFNECWDLCIKIKDQKGIHQNNLRIATEDFNKI